MRQVDARAHRLGAPRDVLQHEAAVVGDELQAEVVDGLACSAGARRVVDHCALAITERCVRLLDDFEQYLASAEPRRCGVDEDCVALDLCQRHRRREMVDEEIEDALEDRLGVIQLVLGQDNGIQLKPVYSETALLGGAAQEP